MRSLALIPVILTPMILTLAGCAPSTQWTADSQPSDFLQGEQVNASLAAAVKMTCPHGIDQQQETLVWTKDAQFQYTQDFSTYGGTQINHARFTCRSAP